MTPVLASLWRGHGRTALVDTGAGVCDALWPGGAGLPAALERLGVAREEITDVVLTHLDFDHAGGVVAGTWPEQISPAFPAAAVRVAAFDLDWWWNAEERPLRVGPRILRTLRDAGLLETFSDGAEVLPGVRPDPLPATVPGTPRSRSRTARACSCTWRMRSITAATSCTRSGITSTTGTRDRPGDPLPRCSRRPRSAARCCSPPTSRYPAGSSARVARRPGAITGPDAVS